MTGSAWTRRPERQLWYPVPEEASPQQQRDAVRVRVRVSVTVGVGVGVRVRVTVTVTVTVNPNPNPSPNPNQLLVGARLARDLNRTLVLPGALYKGSPIGSCLSATLTLTLTRTRTLTLTLTRICALFDLEAIGIGTRFFSQVDLPTRTLT